MFLNRRLTFSKMPVRAEAHNEQVNGVKGNCGGIVDSSRTLGHTMKTVTKKDLVDRISDLTNAKRVLVKRVVQTFLDEIVNELGHGNRLEFRDFGVFELRERAPRLAQNPKTMQKVSVPKKRTVKFKVGRLMKAMLQSTSPRSASILADHDGRERVIAFPAIAAAPVDA